MDAAVDAGEFVSFIHKSDRRHFQIEELASWPGCPAIAPDSPLVFWLGEPDAQQAAPQAAVSAPVTRACHQSMPIGLESESVESM